MCWVLAAKLYHQNGTRYALGGMRREMVPLHVSNVKVVNTNLNKAKALAVYVQMAQRHWKMEQYLDLSVLDVLLGRQVMPVA